MNSTKDAHEFTEGKFERRAGGLEGYGLRRSTGDPRFSYASLISNRENS